MALKNDFYRMNEMGLILLYETEGQGRTEDNGEHSRKEVGAALFWQVQDMWPGMLILEVLNDP
ncbi:hypothetical protein DYI25_03530 [Mesobacillus boroniphilus]|uniref:Uncharacterized protein n=1 Tax=Mesobacillus boroniphilus TaxID=308892 RepID=A0A944GWL6_9BACI|nr:hypothetical protein [Mesobacillus boroniphilus]MBS8263511.1 hypothetical protein [Mesobacillus boroniphilus]